MEKTKGTRTEEVDTLMTEVTLTEVMKRTAHMVVVVDMVIDLMRLVF